MNILKYPDIFFTADEHLGHEMFIRTKKRPFSSVEEQDETIIERHNKKVTRGGRVYRLGDMFLKITKEKARGYMRRLKGACSNQFLLVGNHDAIAQDLADMFIWQRHLFQLSVREIGQKIVLCHYAMRTWQGSHKGSWQLYGHSHGDLPELPHLLAFDIGVDCWDFYPVHIEEVAAKMATKMEAFQDWKAKNIRSIGEMLEREATTSR